MISIILVGNGSNEAIAEKLSGLANQANAEVILVAKSRPSLANVNFKFVATEGSSVRTALTLATGMAAGATLLFLDSRASIRTGSIEKVITSLDATDGVTWYAIEQGSETVELEENSPEGVLRALTNDSSLPTAAVAFKKSAFPSAELPEGDSATEIIAKTMIQMIGAQETATRGIISIIAAPGTCTLSDASRASCLKTLVGASNIEELFPRHDWNTHEKESAAASYHSLAALFLRLGDSESALECLRLSDQLEDSPRSLALKGLIAIDRGEILGAVANMVSSLQQYEIRKKENESHYSQFQPSDLGAINDNLNAGLQALNKRENERALNYFAEAVFNFDPFFSQYGVNRVRLS